MHWSAPVGTGGEAEDRVGAAVAAEDAAAVAGEHIPDAHAAIFAGGHEPHVEHLERRDGPVVQYEYNVLVLVLVHEQFADALHFPLRTACVAAASGSGRSGRRRSKPLRSYRAPRRRCASGRAAVPSPAPDARAST